jgi:hypothetical protein
MSSADYVEAGPGSGHGHLLVAAGPVGVVGVHMKVAGDLE